MRRVFRYLRIDRSARRWPSAWSEKPKKKTRSAAALAIREARRELFTLSARAEREPLCRYISYGRI